MVSVSLEERKGNNFELIIHTTGLIYLPEIMYRRILNEAFGPGGWALMPRGDTLHYQVNWSNFLTVVISIHGKYPWQLCINVTIVTSLTTVFFLWLSNASVLLL